MGSPDSLFGAQLSVLLHGCHTVWRGGGGGGLMPRAFPLSRDGVFVNGEVHSAANKDWKQGTGHQMGS